MMCPIYIEEEGFACPIYFKVRYDEKYIYGLISFSCVVDLPKKDKSFKVKYKYNKLLNMLMLIYQGKYYNYKPYVEREN